MRVRCHVLRHQSHWSVHETLSLPALSGRGSSCPPHGCPDGRHCPRPAWPVRQPVSASRPSCPVTLLLGAALCSPHPWCIHHCPRSPVDLCPAALSTPGFESANFWLHSKTPQTMCFGGQASSVSFFVAWLFLPWKFWGDFPKTEWS